MRALAAALAGLALATPGATAADSSLGRFALARDGALVVLDLDTRRERVLVSRGARASSSPPGAARPSASCRRFFTTTSSWLTVGDG